MKYVITVMALALSAAPYQAAAHDEGIVSASTLETPENTLKAYRSAIESLDGSEMQSFFTSDAQIFENGSAEGSFGNYMDHHLGPELKEFESFTFSNVDTQVLVAGNSAMSSETYSYTIVLKDGRTIERQGVATAVLVQQNNQWKIAQYHSSSRAPKK